MSASAKITVNSGPNRGIILEMSQESVHIGSGADSALKLTDSQMTDRQLCIARRGARHAIYVSGTDEVEVDGTRIPPEQWVWLPQSASVQVTRRTALEFHSLLTLSDADFDSSPSEAISDTAVSPDAASSTTTSTTTSSSASASAAPSTNTATTAGRRTPRKAEGKGTKSKPAVARFITDQAGDPLVRLGADGHLPELALQDLASTVPRKTAVRANNPLILILVFAISMGLSLLMLFVDLELPTGTAHERLVARKAIKFFYGDDLAPLEPYQKLLREANWAYSQGDTLTERKRLRDVLKLLRAENRDSIASITRLQPEASQRIASLKNTEIRTLSTTADPFMELTHDRQLERLLSILLSSE